MDKKMRIAVLVCVLVILVSTFVSARSGVAKLVRTASDAFVEGTDGSGYSIYSDLQKRVALSRNLRTVALRYIDSSDPLIADLASAADLLEGERSPEKAYEANQALSDAASAVDRKLSGLELTATDENYRIGIMTDLASYSSTIAHDGYNELVRSVKDELSRFPANIFSKIGFVGGVEYFK